VFTSNSLASISVITIFSLFTDISIVVQFLFIVSTTSVHAGPLIQVITSFREFSSFTSLQSTFVTISHHLSHAFSEGEPGIGEFILSTPGFSISTYDQIPSYSHDNIS
jgi:hypothetical protein